MKAPSINQARGEYSDVHARQEPDSTGAGRHDPSPVTILYVSLPLPSIPHEHGQRRIPDIAVPGAVSLRVQQRAASAAVRETRGVLHDG